MPSYLSDIRPCYDNLTFPQDEVMEILTYAEPELKCVDVELGQERQMGVTVGVCLELVEVLGGMEFVDAADSILSLRIVKVAGPKRWTTCARPLISLVGPTDASSTR